MSPPRSGVPSRPSPRSISIPTLNVCLSLTRRQGQRWLDLNEGWSMTWARLGEGEERGYHRPGKPSSGAWEPAEVPRLHRGVKGRESLWYRLEFRDPHFERRTLLRFEGAFLSANVWLNGKLLGSHYGYFAPFSFDISSHLRERNTLAICVESPVETELQAKRQVMGVFNDWDCKPYPNNAFFTLPESYEWHVPIGLWGAVGLEQVGAVVVEHVHFVPELKAAEGAQIRVEARLRNLDARRQSGRLRLQMEPANFDSDSPPVSLLAGFDLDSASAGDLRVVFNLPQARLWWPWTLGRPHLYSGSARVVMEGYNSAEIRQEFGVRSIEVQSEPGRWSFVINGRLHFVKGANYMPEFMLDRLDAETMARDIDLAVHANMDMLRVHAHVSPEHVYSLADQRGVLLFTDFPMIFAYAHGRGEADQRFLRAAALSQVPEMVNQLRNHASIALWCAHNEPPWPDRLNWFGDAHTAQTNRDLDHEIRDLFQTLDPQRPAIAASGDTDEHVYLGWYNGHWRDYASERPAFPTEYGAQSLPNADSPFWENVTRQWPVDADDPSWRYAGYQPLQWQQYGVGAPSDFPDLSSYIRAGQVYQAWVCRFATDRFRRLKFQPTAGALVFQLVDCHDGISWSLLDYHRMPKLAYHEMRLALQPTQVIIEPAGEWAPAAAGTGIQFDPDGETCLRLYVVNDDPGVGGEARLDWSLTCVQPDAVGAVEQVRGMLSARSLRGRATVQLPGSESTALQVAEIRRQLRRRGEYRLEVRLTQGDRELARRTLPFRVGRLESVSERVMTVPGFMVGRVYQRGSLSNSAEGFSLTLSNRMQPFALENLNRFTVDGVDISVERIEVESHGETVPLRSRLPMDLPVGTPIRFHVVGEPLSAGEHTIDLSVSVVGFGRVLLKLKDSLA